MEENENIEDSSKGWINWWEFAPVGDTFICETMPDVTKKETESGIIFETQESVILDRPFKGVVISVGPEAKYKIGEYLYWSPQSGMDLAMMKPEKDGQKFILLHTDAIMGRRVKDTRE